MSSLISLSPTAGRPPTSLGASRCVVWLSGDSLAGNANNTALTLWPDSSGNGRDFTLAGATKPTWKTGIQNGRGAVYFDGASSTGLRAGIALTAFHTVLAVVLGNAANTNSVLGEHSADANSNDGHYIYTTGLVNRRTALTSANIAANQNPLIEPVAKVMAFQFNCRNVGYRVNGQPLIATTTVGATGGTTATTQYNLCSRNQASLFFVGHVAEYVIMDGPVSDQELANLEYYFHRKYAI